ncbi:MAG: tetratricopeptide repeat protein [Bacteroidetes bacterium]|nr:tetratricopeptide repeat protein [Bacteroidota bacterium]
MSRTVHVAVIVLGFVLAGTIAASAQSVRDSAKTAAANGDYTGAASLYEQALKASPKDKDVLVEAADVDMELDRFAAARDLYARARDVDSRDQVLTRKYVEALTAVGDHPKAVATMLAAVKDNASMENYLALGQAQLAGGKDSISRAELTFQTASQKYPNSAEVAVALGDLYFARDIFELAQQKYEEAIKINPNLIESRIRLGRAYREQARREDDSARINDLYNKSLLEFNRVTALAPRQPRPWLEQGEIFMLAHLYEKAGRSFQQYVELRPDDPRGDVLLARAAFGGNFYVQAIPPLERILAKNDSVSKAFADHARYMLGKSYYASKEYVKAREAYALVSDSLFNTEGRKLYISSIMQSGGDTNKAVDMYRKLVADNPKDCDMSLSLGGLLYSMKRYDEVISVFTTRMTNCPDAPKTNPYLYIGLAYFTQNKYDQTVEALNNSIAADSTNAQAYYWLMNAYAKKEQYVKAGDLARVMVARGMDKTNPKEVATGYFFAGADRFKAKDYRGALTEFEKVIKLSPENAQAYLYMAYSYQLSKDKDNACRSYKLALKYDPKNAEALKNMKALGCD